jgi:hypothetical protein
MVGPLTVQKANSSLGLEMSNNEKDILLTIVAGAGTVPTWSKSSTLPSVVSKDSSSVL